MSLFWSNSAGVDADFVEESLLQNFAGMRIAKLPPHDRFFPDLCEGQ